MVGSCRVTSQTSLTVTTSPRAWISFSRASWVGSAPSPVGSGLSEAAVVALGSGSGGGDPPISDMIPTPTKTMSTNRATRTHQRRYHGVSASEAPSGSSGDTGSLAPSCPGRSSGSCDGLIPSRLIEPRPAPARPTCTDPLGQAYPAQWCAGPLSGREGSGGLVQQPAAFLEAHQFPEGVVIGGISGV